MRNKGSHKNFVVKVKEKTMANEIVDYTEAIRLDPNDATAYYRRGMAYKEKGDYDRAIADFTEAIRLNPNGYRAYVDRGMAYGGKGDYDRAIADFTEAIRINPNDYRACFDRGMAYREKEDYDRAIADFTEAIRINPNIALAYGDRGMAYGEKGDYDRAIVDLSEAIRLDPNDATAYGYRGAVYVKKGDYDRAIADFTQAIRLDPNDALTYHNRFLAYGKKNDRDRAIADIEMAVKLAPDNVEWREQLARVKAIVGHSGYSNPPVVRSKKQARYMQRIFGDNCYRHQDRAATAYCAFCGAPVCDECHDGTYCRDCIEEPPKKKSTALLLAVFLGWLGIHRFYMRFWVTGIIYLITFGLYGIGWAIDVIRILLFSTVKQDSTGSFVDDLGYAIMGNAPSNIRDFFEYCLPWRDKFGRPLLPLGWKRR
jgi:tetratricopeptide (TPR) repeat protein